MEQILKSHILDLANRSYNQNIYTFSGFLTVGEQSDIYEMSRELKHVHFDFFGGGEECERKMIRFGSADVLGYEEDFPISCLVVKPLIKKFADDLTHRDFLGSLMNLGINRDVLGDIIVKNNVGYVFCEDQMAEYLKEHLDRIKHTSVMSEITRECPESARPDFLEDEFVVSSNRCDAVIAKVYNLSRSQSIEIFRAKGVYVDGRLYENNSGVLKDGCIVSVRGHGKFVFTGFLNETKKGRIRVAVKKYI